MINNMTEVNNTAPSLHSTISNNFNSSLEGFFSLPPPSDFPFRGRPTQTMFDLITQLFQRFSFSKSTFEATKILESFNKLTESVLLNVKELTIPRSVYQFFQVFPVYKNDLREFTTLASIVEAVLNGDYLYHEELDSFLKTQVGSNLDLWGQSRLFRTLMSKTSFRNLNRLLEIFFDKFSDFDISNEDNTGIYSIQHLCGIYCNINALKVLLKQASANPDIHVSPERGTPLHIALSFGHTKEATELLAHNLTNPNAVRESDGNTPLHCAVIHGKVENIKLLLNTSGVNTNIKNAKGETAFHLAAQLEDESGLPIVDAFLQHAALPNSNLNTNSQRASDGSTALHIAVAIGSIENVKLLLKAEGIDTNIKNADGKTAFHLAAQLEVESALPMVEAFLQHAALPNSNLNLDAQDSNGNTALHLALNNNWQIVEALIKHPNINFYLKNNAGRIPIDLLVTVRELVLKSDIDKNFAKFILSIIESRIVNHIAVLRKFFKLPLNINTYDELIWHVNKVLMENIHVDPKSIFKRQRTGKM